MTAPAHAALPGSRERWRVLEADTLRALPTFADACVDAVVTDPPYGISFDGRDWDGRAIHQATTTAKARRLTDGQAFERWSTIWATELARILKPGGHLLAFAAPRMSHRLTTGLEEGGLEIRDVLMWLYGEGMPKSRRLPGGVGTALKPAYEPIILARRPPQGPVARNIRRHATGALNIDACRIPAPSPVAQSVGGAQATSSADSVGRWPANVLLTHAATCRPGRCAPACPVARLDTQGAAGSTRLRGDCAPRPGPSRFFYCAKASRRERDAGCGKLPAHHLDLFPNAHRRRRSAPTVVRNAHPTVKPIELMRWLVRLACPSGGLVLDPFCGSGSTGAAAVLEQRRFLGIELDPDSARVARARIAHLASDPTVER
jgi:site-specific DNA-methyltransferase (adenine-specific)